MQVNNGTDAAQKLTPKGQATRERILEHASPRAVLDYFVHLLE